MLQANLILINEKIDSLLRCIERLKSKTPSSFNKLEDNIDSQDIISINLERAIQICVDISSHIIAHSSLKSPATMADSFVILANAKIITSEIAVKMQKAVTLRNILVHEYKEVEWSIIWNVLNNNLEDFVQYVQEINAYFTTN